MKKIIFVILFALACIPVRAQGFAHFPAFKPWVLTWDHTAPANSCSFNLFNGPTQIATLSTNEFVLAGVTNGLATYRATVPAILLGTNVLTMIAISGDTPSLPSLPLIAVGELPPPQNLRP